MKTINIFIAGAKELAPQRTKLKALLSDLNHRLQRSSGIRLSVASYETYGNDQNDYDAFIANEADLLMLILQDRIGQKTEDEYLLAHKTKQEKGKPETVVFLQHIEEDTHEIAYINGLLKKEKYYYTYVNDEELLMKAKDYVEAFVAATPVTPPEPQPAPKRKLPVKYILIGLIVALVAAVACIGVFYYENQKSTLMVLGGGSAKNYLQQYHGVTLDGSTNPMYVHVPSESAWILLTEEVITPQSEKIKYIPVCISASKAQKKDFLDVVTEAEFMEKGHIVEYKFQKRDTLVVYVEDSKEVDRFRTSNKISVDELMELLQQKTYNIYTTTPNSGTRRIYDSLLIAPDYALKDDTTTLQYSENSDAEHIQSPYIMLGSKCYKPLVLDEAKQKEGGVEKNRFNYLELQIYDENTSCFAKDIYLYFMAYKEFPNRTSGTDLYVPDATINFLKSLENVNNIDIDLLEDNTIDKANNSLIIELENIVYRKPN